MQTFGEVWGYVAALVLLLPILYRLRYLLMALLIAAIPTVTINKSRKISCNERKSDG